MEKLPVLREDFPEFDWNTSSEIASAEQKAIAYASATNQGQCADFHRYVWNDMVITLAEALEEAGIEWNDSYGTFIQTTLLLQYDALTARKFNALRLNMDSIAPTGWKWASQKNLVGYVGRKNFYGVTERGSNADILYGWYMLEIARKLNLTLKIMKNTADFSEFAAVLQSNTMFEADAKALPSVPMDVLYRSICTTMVDLHSVPSKPISIEYSAKSKTNAIIENVKSAPIRIDGKSKSFNDAIIETVKSAPIFAEKKVFTLNKAELNIQRSINTETYNLIRTLCRADMDIWKSLYVECSEISKSGYDAEIRQFPSQHLDQKTRSKTSYRSEIMSREALGGSAVTKSKTLSNAEPAQVEGLAIQASSISKSSGKASLDKLLLKMLSITEKSKSKTNVTLDSAWYPPELVEDGVYFVRQVYDYNFDENTGVLEVI